MGKRDLPCHFCKKEGEFKRTYTYLENEYGNKKVAVCPDCKQYMGIIRSSKKNKKEVIKRKRKLNRKTEIRKY